VAFSNLQERNYPRAPEPKQIPHLGDCSNPLPHKTQWIFGRIEVRQMEAQAKHDMEIAFNEKDGATWPWENL